MENTTAKITRIVSGGKRGVDQVALDVASEFNIQAIHGKIGAITYNRNVADTNQLCQVEDEYVTQIRKDIDGSDATLVIRLYRESVVDGVRYYSITGKWRTALASPRDIEEEDHYRPCCVISDVSADAQADAIKKITDFLMKHRVRTLYITGHHRVPHARCVNFLHTVYDILHSVLTRVNK